jgi:nucleoid-associated protein YgaU
MSLPTAYVADMGRVLIRLIATTASVFGFLLGGIAWADRNPVPARLPVVIANSGADTTVIVAKGDHLWKISGHHLHSVLGRPATNTEISPYWRRVVDTNRSNLRSGNPDLIYPGEIVTLPAVSD